MTHVALVGASGFVGAAVQRCLERRGAVVSAIAAPRLRTSARVVDDLLDEADRCGDAGRLVDQLEGCDVVVNAAGDPDASSTDLEGLLGANALLPGVIAGAAVTAGVARFVHVSSAVVQNDIDRLDESESMLPFSAYSLSKALGEEVVRAAGGELHTVRYRPPSVHAPGRGVTVKVARIAGSRLAYVAGPGNQGTPQALLQNVGDAVAFLAVTDQVAPAVVMHPSEGVTVSSLMRDLSGGRAPRVLPAGLARTSVRVVKRLGRHSHAVAANARRVELLWLGQEQAPSWLETAGWTPPVGPAAWRDLGRTARGE